VGLKGIMTNPLRLVMELCDGGDLHKLLITSDDSLTWESKLNLLLDIAKYVLLLLFSSSFCIAF